MGGRAEKSDPVAFQCEHADIVACDFHGISRLTLKTANGFILFDLTPGECARSSLENTALPIFYPLTDWADFFAFGSNGGKACLAVNNISACMLFWGTNTDLLALLSFAAVGMNRAAFSTV